MSRILAVDSTGHKYGINAMHDPNNNSITVGGTLTVNGQLRVLGPGGGELLCVGHDHGTPSPSSGATPYVLEKDRPLVCLCERTARVVSGVEIRCPCGRRLRGDARAWRLWIRKLATERYIEAGAKAAGFSVRPAGIVSDWTYNNIIMPAHARLVEEMKKLDRVLLSTRLDEDAVLDTLSGS